jgi:hypothetical protein
MPSFARICETWTETVLVEMTSRRAISPLVGPRVKSAAYAIVDAYVYGFVLQHVSLPFDTGDSATAVADSIMAAFAAGAYPHMVEFATEYLQRPGYDFAGQFEFGLDLILDALAHVAGQVGDQPHGRS